MPTVLRQGGFNFKIITNDHEPMHVHVWHQGGEVIIKFENDVVVRENNGLSRNEERRALLIVGEHQKLFQSEWRRIYGQNQNR